MRKMKRSDVREWIPGEPLERVDFGNGCTGMNKSLPTEGHALMCFHPNTGLTT